MNDIVYSQEFIRINHETEDSYVFAVDKVRGVFFFHISIGCANIVAHIRPILEKPNQSSTAIKLIVADEKGKDLGAGYLRMCQMAARHFRDDGRRGFKWPPNNKVVDITNKF